jgi:hypothetical protein
MMAKFLLVEVGFNESTRYVATVTTLTSALAILIARPNPSHRLRKPKTWTNFRVFVDLHAYRYTPFAWLTASICFLFFGFYAVFFNLEEWAAATGLGYKDEIPGGPDISLQNEVPRDAVRTFCRCNVYDACLRHDDTRWCQSQTMMACILTCD